MSPTLRIHRHDQRNRLTAKVQRIAVDMHQRLGDDPATTINITLGPGGAWGTLQVARAGDVFANAADALGAWYGAHPPEACEPDPEPRCAGCAHDRGASGCVLMSRSPSDTPAGRAWLWYRSSTSGACPERTDIPAELPA